MSLAKLNQKPTPSICKLTNSTNRETSETDCLRQLCLRHCSVHIDNPFDARLAVAAHNGRTHLLELLEAAGFSDLVDVFDSLSPMRTIRSLMPDLILIHIEPKIFQRQLDWKTPPSSIDVISAAKADSKTSSIPVIAITTNLDVVQRQRAAQFGVNEILCDPTILR